MTYGPQYQHFRIVPFNFTCRYNLLGAKKDAKDIFDESRKEGTLPEANPGLLQAVNCYHKMLRLGCCSSPGSSSDSIFKALELTRKCSSITAVTWRSCLSGFADAMKIRSVKYKLFTDIIASCNYFVRLYFYVCFIFYIM